MEKIILEIDLMTGNMKLDAQGYRGGKCKTDINELTALLNASVTSVKNKPELQRVVHTQKAGR